MARTKCTHRTHPRMAPRKGVPRPGDTHMLYPKPTRKSQRIRRAENEPHLPKQWSEPANDQACSLLFKNLPAEVRFIIYRYALSVVDDQCLQELQHTTEHDLSDVTPRSVSDTKYVHRPPPQRRGYTKQYSLSLLQTCQAVYAEACDLAISANTHVLLYPLRGMEHFPNLHEATKYFSRMTNPQIRQVKYLHLFVGANKFSTHDRAGWVGGYGIQTPFAELALLRNGSAFCNSMKKKHVEADIKPIHPLTLTITVRDSEWSVYDITEVGLTEVFLRNKRWENLLGSVQRLRMELEIETSIKHVLEEELSTLVEYEFDVGNNRKLVSRTRAVSEGRWTRTREARWSLSGRGDILVNTFDVLKDLTVYTMEWESVSAE